MLRINSYIVLKLLFVVRKTQKSFMSLKVLFYLCFKEVAKRRRTQVFIQSHEMENIPQKIKLYVTKNPHKKFILSTCANVTLVKLQWKGFASVMFFRIVRRVMLNYGAP